MVRRCGPAGSVLAPRLAPGSRFRELSARPGGYPSWLKGALSRVNRQYWPTSPRSPVRIGSPRLWIRSSRGPSQVGRAVSFTARPRQSAPLATRGGGSALSALGGEPRGAIGTDRPCARRAQTLALSDSQLAGVGDRGPDGNGASHLRLDRMGMHGGSRPTDGNTLKLSRSLVDGWAEFNSRVVLGGPKGTSTMFDG